MLLSHRTGWLQHVFESQRFLGELFHQLQTDPGKYYHPEELFRTVTYDTSLFEANSSYHYSDMNYIALGRIIEKATANSYYSEMSNEILVPLSLNHTYPADRQDLPCVVNGYMRPDDPFALLHPTSMDENGLVFNPSLEWTGGGLVTNSGDLAKWAALLWGGKWLSDGSVGVMTENYSYPDHSPGEGYGYGTQIMRTELGTLLGHSGYYPGYNTIMGYFADLKIGAAIQINRDHGNGPLRKHLVALAKAFLEGSAE
jgi:D-alanyl-D-alanine carboxypeptidase